MNQPSHLLLISICLCLVGCSFSLPRVHKVTVQQGNVITQEMIDKLKPGMTRTQVAFVMGEPIVRNTFDDDRWDYIYTVELPGYYEEVKRLTVYFDNDQLAYFTGNLPPTNQQPSTPEIDKKDDTEDESTAEPVTS